MDNLNANTQPNTSMPSMPQIPRMISIQQVEDCIGLSSSTIYDMLNKRSKRYDPTFPVQVKMTKGRVAWVESEVAQWIERKMAARFH
ncbi:MULTISPECIES: helix-turn-helix transcriptional regulator [unclassified Psychrobacter]|jgi:prophage regulatory protein|uniref:helix-turn-helix transcriptional regulator n=2 Tax=Psychrobacter TaxID=497 RepID=UPI002E7BF277|nr:AlpA family phage regulatory protein [Psychrobacter sp. CCUG 69069]